MCKHHRFPQTNPALRGALVIDLMTDRRMTRPAPRLVPPLPALEAQFDGALWFVPTGRDDDPTPSSPAAAMRRAA